MSRTFIRDFLPQDDFVSDEVKQREPEYILIGVDFNPSTRIAKILINQTQQYRTIERYVTRNYKKYPVYSNWKTKFKEIKKSIKLTNEVLEQLPQNDDKLIRLLSFDIVKDINKNNNIFPSWYSKKCFLKEQEKQIQQFNWKKQEILNKKNQLLESNQHLIQSYCDEIQFIENNLSQLNSRIQKISNKINGIDNATDSLWKRILSFFIYCYFISEKRKNHLTDKLNQFKEDQTEHLNRLEFLKKNKEFYENDNLSIVDRFAKQLNLIDCQINEVKTSTQKKISQIVPLDNNYSTTDNFIPLKNIIGFEYEKIIGCYLIHNTENDKYYVGQSKDVLRRLKQHFKGTIPNNIIFAEDYYSSKYANKEDIFEIKIIPCQTKDDLDSTEKRLIEEYDACNTGYNRTQGNS